MMLETTKELILFILISRAINPQFCKSPVFEMMFGNVEEFLIRKGKQMGMLFLVHAYHFDRKGSSRKMNEEEIHPVIQAPDWLPTRFLRE